MIQQTTFSFELVIGEDCSTDNTRKICKEYQVKYPDKIHLLLPVKNLGMQTNSIATLNACTGKYIAICEGDDYWTDSLKLQKQVDFLEANKTFSMCVSNRLVKQIDGQFYKDVKDKGLYTKQDILHGEIPNTQTMVFINKLDLYVFLKEFLKSMQGDGDRAIAYWCSLHGNIYCLPEITAVYRDSGFGVWSIYSDEEKVWLQIKSFCDFHNKIGIPNRQIYVSEMFRRCLDVVYYGWKRKQPNPFRIKIIKLIFQQLTISEIVFQGYIYMKFKLNLRKKVQIHK
jgi:glycosyltransferase involved in cell wall biosynthesis